MFWSRRGTACARSAGLKRGAQARPRRADSVLGGKALMEGGEKKKKRILEGGEFGSVLSPVKSFKYSFEERDLI